MMEVSINATSELKTYLLHVTKGKFGRFLGLIDILEIPTFLINKCLGQSKIKIFYWVARI